MWSVIFKKDFLCRNAIYFEEDVSIGEDLIFRLYTSQYARNMQYVDYCYYHYRNNKNSASCVYRETAIVDSLKELAEIKRFITKYNRYELEKAYKFRIVEVMTVLPLRCFFHKNNPNTYIKRREQAKSFMHSDIIQSNVTESLIKELPLKRKIQVFLLKNSLFEIYMLIIKGNSSIKRIN